MRAAEVGTILVHKSVGRERIVRHGMLVHTVRLKVAHHVCDARLGRRLRAFLVGHFTRVHVAINLVEVLLGSRVQLAGEVLLRLQRSRLRLRDLVHLEAGAHRRVHYDLARRLYLLQAVECYIIQIRRRVEVAFFIAHHLLEEVVAARLTLLLLEQQVVR